MQSANSVLRSIYSADALWAGRQHPLGAERQAGQAAPSVTVRPACVFELFQDDYRARIAEIDDYAVELRTLIPCLRST